MDCTSTAAPPSKKEKRNKLEIIVSIDDNLIVKYPEITELVDTFREENELKHNLKWKFTSNSNNLLSGLCYWYKRFDGCLVVEDDVRHFGLILMSMDQFCSLFLCLQSAWLLVAKYYTVEQLGRCLLRPAKQPPPSVLLSYMAQGSATDTAGCDNNSDTMRPPTALPTVYSDELQSASQCASQCASAYCRTATPSHGVCCVIHHSPQPRPCCFRVLIQHSI